MSEIQKSINFMYFNAELKYIFPNNLFSLTFGIISWKIILKYHIQNHEIKSHFYIKR